MSSLGNPLKQFMAVVTATREDENRWWRSEIASALMCSIVIIGTFFSLLLVSSSSLPSDGISDYCGEHGYEPI
jgi:hypothetical protein